MHQLLEFTTTPDLLTDHVILITGAANGIGRAVALACADCRATVILLDKDASGLDVVYDEIAAKDAAPAPVIVEQDLADLTPAHCDALVQQIKAHFGRLDGLLHNAAELGRLCPIEHYKVSVWERTIETNLNAPFLLTHTCLPLLMQSGKAVLIFTSHATGSRPQAYWGAYGAANAAVENLAATLAEELESGPVRVHCVDPGPVQTDMPLRTHPGISHAHQLKPDAVAAAYVSLFSNNNHAAERGVIRLQPDALVE